MANSLNCIPNTKFSRKIMENDENLMSAKKKWKALPPSIHAENTINPILDIVHVMDVKPNSDKQPLKLNIGDPTVCRIFATHSKVTEAVTQSLLSGRYNGYGPSVGFPEVRKALADFVTHPEAPVIADDIVLGNGCSHALQMAIEAIADPGQNILVPRPCFSMYATLMKPHGIEDRFYNLIMEKGWEADLKHMDSQIDDKTAAIIVNNPSNPCGAVYSKSHLEDILKLAQKRRVPIIADEIYGSMVYNGAKFYPMATLKPKVPIITCDGISKRYLVPGWRLGWLVLHNVDGSLDKIRTAIRNLAQKIVGPCALIQGALPFILKNVPNEFFDHSRRVLEENAHIVCNSLENAPGLKPIMSNGAMYMMIGVDLKHFPKYDTTLDFVKGLIIEESVYCLPGDVFGYPEALRIVLANENDYMAESCSRIVSFCKRHFIQK